MVICVRSLVPKEKNSATSAIWSAERRARHLDHGADQVFQLDVLVADDPIGHAAVRCSRICSSFVDGRGS
jgi:hypothetical protein